jgi:hypothetical protein
VVSHLYRIPATCHFYTETLCNYMVQCVISLSGHYSTGYEISFLKSTKFITMPTKPQHCTLYKACLVQLTSSYHHHHTLSSVFSHARISFRLLLLFLFFSFFSYFFSFFFFKTIVHTFLNSRPAEYLPRA